ncbi:aminoacyl-tRNA hydrolase [Candidatus Wolfebacteria bacterium]|nr:aminoacyl-tRNA hydrolase [Candidatus Wolfebacteria bacterium]
MDEIKAIVGLGNPGQNYQRTYHNIGFLALNYLKKEGKIDSSESFKHPRRQSFEYLKLGQKILIKSCGFMNESGGSVLVALKYFRLKPKELVVIHDDSDIPLGDYKLSFGRGSAGHRGVESIIQALGTKNFWRIRVGIRHLDGPKVQANKLVLKKMSAEEFKKIRVIFKTIRGIIN